MLDSMFSAEFIWSDDILEAACIDHKKAPSKSSQIWQGLKKGEKHVVCRDQGYSSNGIVWHIPLCLWLLSTGKTEWAEHNSGQDHEKHKRDASKCLQ